MIENSARKPPTDFTIDCILSKNDNQNCEQQKSPTINHPMNRVLDNPWISKCPLALTFNPSTHRKVINPSAPSPVTPNIFNFFNPPHTTNFAENLVKVTQHFTSVHNHFYPATASTSSDTPANSDDIKSLPKLPVYDNTSCDSLSLNETFSVKHEISSPTTPNSIQHKCSICAKTFESSDILNVGLRMQRMVRKELIKNPPN